MLISEISSVIRVLDLLCVKVLFFYLSRWRYYWYWN